MNSDTPPFGADAAPPDPLVAVVMACHNSARTVEAAARSVLGQSLSALELIVVDDASTDNSAEILRRINDSRLRVVSVPVNVGPGPARDRAITLASAPWIAVIDADDEWAPQRLHSMLTLARQHAPCMVFDDLMICHDTPAGLVEWKALRGPGAFGAIEGAARRVPLENFIRSDRLLIKPLFPRTAVLANRLTHSTRRFGEDAEFFIRLAAHGVPMFYLPEPLYRYRINPGSLTASSGDPSAMRRSLEAVMQDATLAPTIRAALAEKCSTLRSSEDMYAVVAALRKLNLIEATAISFRRPALIPALVRRSLVRLGYELHRIRWKGASRDI